MLNNLKRYNSIKVVIRERQLKAIVEKDLVFLIKTSAIKISIIFNTYVVMNTGKASCIRLRSTSEVKDAA